FASMNVLTRKYIKRIAPSRLNADRLWLCIPLLLAMQGFQLPSDLSPPLVGYAALAALVGPLGSRLPFMFYAANREARYTPLVAMSSPVWALLFSWVFLGTWPTRGELFGGLVILAGVSVPLISEVGGLRTLVMRRQRKSST
ncbi:MAG: DMT family transporter, partial [Myxococcota bacterium]